MADLNLVLEMKAKERSLQYHRDLLREDPFNWSQRLTVQSLEAEIEELRKGICLMNMQQCG